MKKFLVLILALCLILSFSACGGKENDNEKKEITLCLDWTPNTNHTGFYVAAEKGYYEEAGLSVKIVQPPENGAALMCASGQAQFAVDAQDTIAPSFASDSPLEITAVASILQHNTSGIISRKGEGMNSPKGMEGKTYSTWDSPTEKAIIKYVVEKDGGDFSKINLIPNVITDEAGALKNHDTDCVWVFYGWSAINAKLSGLEFDYFSFREIDPVFDYYTPVIVANNAFLENSGETAKAFLSATAKGYEYAAENPEEAAEILIRGDETGSLLGSEELVKESQKWISQQYIADGEKWGIIDETRWNGFYSWLYNNGLVEKDLTEKNYFTNNYLG
ncbi:MAG: ABC transporter substrate-binding protein [Clostridia bacterium]|nr:ABC transporter substrate-binding protein [Clostridia bacterium]